MQRYAIALGSNRPHGRHGDPRAVIAAAMARLAAEARLVAHSGVHDTPPMGPAGRRFANAAIVVDTGEAPPVLLARLKRIERDFGRRRGLRWGARVLDLDILLWSGGGWRSVRPRLSVPHAGIAERGFVLDPLMEIAPDWPVAGALRVRHLAARLTRIARLPRGRSRSGP